LVYSLGGESLSVSQSAIVSNWFKGKELAMALGLNLSVSRLGSVINGLVVPQVYNDEHPDNLGIALLIGFFICVFSFVCAILLILMDKRADAVDGKGEVKVLSEEDKFKFSDIKTFNKSFWLLCFSCVIVYMAIFPYI
jgi:nitrate/nitrite transporter NarK